MIIIIMAGWHLDLERKKKQKTQYCEIDRTNYDIFYRYVYFAGTGKDVSCESLLYSSNAVRFSFLNDAAVVKLDANSMRRKDGQLNCVKHFAMTIL